MIIQGYVPKLGSVNTFHVEDCVLTINYNEQIGRVGNVHEHDDKFYFTAKSDIPLPTWILSSESCQVGLGCLKFANSPDGSYCNVEITLIIPASKHFSERGRVTNIKYINNLLLGIDE